VAEDLVATLQEALTNVVRHAEARRVVIEISAGEDIALSVVDDGRGVPDEHRAGARGLQNMRDRAARLGGTCEVSRGRAGGTAVEWRVPAKLEG
jgi:signal transduction histidine kinase